jgi:hypothetical protein
MNLSLYPHGTGRRIGCRCRVLDRRTFTATFIGCLSCILAGMKRALRAKVDRDKGGDKGTGGTKSPPATTSFLCLHSFAKPGDATFPERDCARRVSRRKLARSEDARTVLNRSTVRTLLRLVGDTPAVRDGCCSPTFDHTRRRVTVELRVASGGLYSCPWKNPFARRNGHLFSQRNPARIGGAVAGGPRSSLFVTVRTRAPACRR